MHTEPESGRNLTALRIRFRSKINGLDELHVAIHLDRFPV